MDERIYHDLLAAHADGLVAGEAGWEERYAALFPAETDELEALITLAEALHALFTSRVAPREGFRRELRASLLASAHQRRHRLRQTPWRWAALGASAVTVAGVIAAAAWRGQQNRSLN